jgi:hypothetical protein
MICVLMGLLCEKKVSLLVGALYEIGGMKQRQHIGMQLHQG